MTLCLLFLAGEPVLLAMSNSDAATDQTKEWSMHVSPIQTVWALSESTIEWSSGPWRSNVVGAAVAAMVGWTLFGLFVWAKARY